MHVGLVDAAGLRSIPAAALVVCAAPRCPFTGAECAALRRHVQAGGSLLLLLQSQASAAQGVL